MKHKQCPGDSCGKPIRIEDDYCDDCLRVENRIADLCNEHQKELSLLEAQNFRLVKKLTEIKNELEKMLETS